MKSFCGVALAALLCVAPAAESTLPHNERLAPSVQEFVCEVCESSVFPPSVIVALIERESGYQTHAVSSCGAIGLMQIMPDTGAYVSEQMGVDLDLFDPLDNIAAGVWLLNHFYGKYQHFGKALMAYAVGEGAAAARWENGETWRQDDVSLLIRAAELEGRGIDVYLP